MIYNNVYYFDPVREVLWILPAKNASTSIKLAAGLQGYISRESAMNLNRHFTVGVIRHPLARAVSGVYTVTNPTQPFRDRLIRYIHNSHIRPQAPAFEGLRVDFMLHVERFKDDWKSLQEVLALPDLLHLNAGALGDGRPLDWREACDWTEFMPLYAKDFILWAS